MAPLDPLAAPASSLPATFDLRITATCRAIDCDHVRSLRRGSCHRLRWTDFSRKRPRPRCRHRSDRRRRSSPVIPGSSARWPPHLSECRTDRKPGLTVWSTRAQCRGRQWRPAASCRLPACRATRIRARVGKILPLEDGAKAHGLIKSGAIKHGRVVLLLR